METVFAIQTMFIRMRKMTMVEEVKRYQLCAECSERTDKCEEDALFAGEYGPLCESCFDRRTDPTPSVVKDGATGEG